MEHTVDSPHPQVRNKRLTGLEGGHQHVKHVPPMLAVPGYKRKSDAILAGPFRKVLIVILPDVTRTRLNLFTMLELREQKGSQYV